MDINRFTQKSQEALQDAQNNAVRYGHAEIDVEHVLLALVEQTDGLVPRLFTKMDVPADSFTAEVQEELERRPKVSGPGAEAGKIVVSQRTNEVLVKAKDEAMRLKDEYVSVEHLLFAMMDEGRSLRPEGFSRSSVSPRAGPERPDLDTGETSGSPATIRKQPTRRWRSTGSTLSRRHIWASWTRLSEGMRRSAG